MSETAASAQPARFDQEALGRTARSIQHPLARALLVLTFTTGIVDAVSYLGLGHVFTANMTGNIVFLGFGLAGSGGLPVLAPLVSLGSFLLGAGGGGVLAERMGDRHPAHIARALAVEVSLIGMAAVLAAAVDARPNAVSGDVAIALLAFAMGARNATVRRLGVPDPDDNRAHDDADRARRGLAGGRGLRQGLGAQSRRGVGDVDRRAGRGTALEDEPRPAAGRSGRARARHLARLRAGSAARRVSSGRRAHHRKLRRLQ